jgi:hypothetical protein
MSRGNAHDLPFEYRARPPAPQGGRSFFLGESSHPMNRISVADLERHHGARPIDQQILFLTRGRGLIRRTSSFETLQPCDIP